MSKSLENKYTALVMEDVGKPLEAPDPLTAQYEKLVQEDTASKVPDLKTAMYSAKDTNPEEYAGVYKLAAAVGLPADMVARNKKVIESEQDFLTGKLDALPTQAPVTAAFLSRDDNAKMAKDDADLLAQMEEQVQLNKGGEFVSDLGRNFIAGLNDMNASSARVPAYAYNVGATLYNTAALPINFALNATGASSAIGTVPEAPAAPEWLLDNPIAEYYARAAEHYSTEDTQGSISGAMEEGDFVKAGKYLAAQVVSNLPQQVFIAASAMLGNPTAGLMWMGALSAASANKTAQDEGKSLLMTTIDATTQGAMEALFEQHGTLGIFESLKKKALGGVGYKEVIKEMGKSVAYAFFGEGAEEFGTTFGQSLSDYLTGDKTAMDGVLRNAIDAFFVGGASGFSTTAPIATAQSLVKSAKLHSDVKWWDKFTGAAENSKLRKRAPEKFQEYTEEVLKENGKPTDIYLQLDAFRQYFKDDAQSFQEVANTLGITDQIAQANDTGAEIEIPVAKWVTEFAGTDISVALKNDIRFGADGMTLNEQKQLKQEQIQNIKEMQQEFARLVSDNTIPQQALTIREKLNTPKEKGGFGLTAEEADTQLAVFLSGVQTLAAKRGETMQQWFNRVNPVVNVGGQYVDPAGTETGSLVEDAAKYETAEEFIESRKLQDGGEAFREEQLVEVWNKAQSYKQSDADPLIEEARKYKTVEEFLASQTQKEYRIQHQIDTEKTTPISDFDEDAIDAYIDAFRAQYGYPALKAKEVKNLKKILGVPEADVTIYRAAPKKELNSGDWVTTDKAYAHDIKRQNGGTVHKYTVKAKELRYPNTVEGFNELPSLNKWGAFQYQSIEGVQQLTDLWNKAQSYKQSAADPLIEEARKYKTVEEFLASKDKLGKSKYNYRGYLPKARGWTKDKIRKVLKQKASESSNVSFQREILKFNSPGELKENLFYHGSGGVIRGLKPSITMSEREAEQSGGGGYGQRYWGISLSKDRNIASNFTAQSRYGNVAPVLLKKGAVVKEMPEIEDAVEIEDIIESLWEDGVDAVKIGDWGDGYSEQEIVVLNPRSIVVGESEGFQVFNKKKMTSFSDEDISKMYTDSAANYEKARVEDYEKRNEAFQEKYGRPLTPLKNSEYLENFKTKQQLTDLWNKAQSYKQAQRNSTRGTLSFMDNAAIIHLYDSANMSTFMHEASHLFTEEMRKMLDEGLGDEQLKKDFDTLKEFAGGALDVEGHETIARGFEAYLREGKAPSIKLTNAFRRFKAWLTAIYKQPGLLRVRLNDEVRAVFDRLLASEQDIIEAEQYYKVKQSIADLMAVTEKQKANIGKKKDKSRDDALEEQLKKYMKAYLEAIGGKAAINQEAAKQVEEMPVYKAEKEAVAAGGFAYEAIASDFGKSVADALRGKNAKLVHKIRKAPQKVKTMYKAVLEYGGINPDTMSPDERKAFREYGLFGLFRKTGRGLDDIAESLINDGVIQPEFNLSPSNQVRAMLEGKENVPFDADYDYDARYESVMGIGLVNIAANNGFESEGALVQAWLDAPTQAQATKNLAAEMVARSEADILKSLKAQEKNNGEESLHNDSSLAFLIAEADVLAAKIEAAKNRRARRIDEKAFTDAAAEAISKKIVRIASRYDLFASAEQRAAKEMFAAAQKGDMEAAYKAQKKRILNHALVRAAVKAREERHVIEKGSKRLGKLTPKTVEFANREAILALLERYGLGTKAMVPQRPDEVNIRALMESMADMDGAQPPVADWILDRQGPTDYRDLTMSQLRELYDTMRMIHRRGRKDLQSVYVSEVVKELTGIQGEVLIEDVASRAAEYMSTLKDKIPVDADKHSFLFGAQRFGRSVLSSISLANIQVQEFDGYVGMGPKGKQGLNETLFMRTLAQADSNKKDIWDKQIGPRLEGQGDIIQGMRGIRKRLLAEMGKTFLIEGVPLSQNDATSRRLLQAGKNMWTPEKVMAFLLNTGNEGNLNALQKAYGMSDAQVAKMRSMLTAEEWGTLQSVWDLVNEFYAPMDTVHFKLNDVHTKKVDAASFTTTTKDGDTITVKGGYYPLIFDQSLSDKASKNAEDDMMKNRMGAVHQTATAKSGFASTRVGGTLPVKLSIDVLYSHLNDVVHYITHAETIRDLDKVSKDPVWANEVRDKFGSEMYEEFRQMLRYVARPETKSQIFVDRLLTRWRKLSTLRALGYNIKSGVKQTLSFTSAAQEIGWQWATTGVKNMVNGKSAFVKDINRMSSYMRNRAKSIDREIQEQMKNLSKFETKINVNGKDIGVKEVRDASFVFVRGFDALTSYSVWDGAFQKYMAENTRVPIDKRTARAIGYADDIVTKTQPSARSMDLSHFQRSDGAARTLSQFMTWTLKYGHRSRAYFRGWTEGKISGQEYYRHLFNEQLLPVLGVFFIHAGYDWLLGRGGDDEEGGFFTGLLETGFSQLLSGYPLLRDAPSMIKYKLQGALDNPIITAQKIHGKSLIALTNIFNSDETLAEKASDIAYALALSTEFESGIPAIKVYKDITKMVNARING